VVSSFSHIPKTLARLSEREQRPSRGSWEYGSWEGLGNMGPKTHIPKTHIPKEYGSWEYGSWEYVLWEYEGIVSFPSRGYLEIGEGDETTYEPLSCLEI